MTPTCDPETFVSLLQDPAHWAFEIVVNLVFDGVVLGIAGSFIRKHWKHHVARDQKEDVTNAQR